MFSFYFGPAGEAISVVKTTVKLASYIIIYSVWYIDQELLQYALLPNNEMTDYMCM